MSAILPWRSWCERKEGMFGNKEEGRKGGKGERDGEGRKEVERQIKGGGFRLGC